MRLLTIFLLLALPLFGKQSERYYQEKFAREIGGQVEVVMQDGTRCDILTATHAIEVDFAKKWAESIGQSLHYALHTGKRPGVALIVLAPSDNKYVERVRKISAEYSLGLTIYPIDEGEEVRKNYFKTERSYPSNPNTYSNPTINPSIIAKV